MPNGTPISSPNATEATGDCGVIGACDRRAEAGRSATEPERYGQDRPGVLATCERQRHVAAGGGPVDRGYESPCRVCQQDRAIAGGRGFEPESPVGSFPKAVGGEAPPAIVHLPDPRVTASRYLTEDEIKTAWEEGRGMSLEQAITYAREVVAGNEP